MFITKYFSAFNEMDENHDGQVSEEEFIEVRWYYYQILNIFFYLYLNWARICVKSFPEIIVYIKVDLYNMTHSSKIINLFLVSLKGKSLNKRKTKIMNLIIMQARIFLLFFSSENKSNKNVGLHESEEILNNAHPENNWCFCDIGMTPGIRVGIFLFFIIEWCNLIPYRNTR